MFRMMVGARLCGLCICTYAVNYSLCIHPELAHMRGPALQGHIQNCAPQRFPVALCDLVCDPGHCWDSCLSAMLSWIQRGYGALAWIVVDRCTPLLGR